MAAEHLHKKEKLIAGHIEERKSWLYCVLNYTVDGKRKQKFVPTGLKAKGNKTRANDMLMDIRREWTEKLSENQKAVELKEAEERGEISPLFADFLDRWLEYKYKLATKQTLGRRKNELNTYAGYETNVNSPIKPYFQAHPFTLETLTKDDIKTFYEEQLERVKVTTVKHYHAVIHGALEYAMELNLITSNPSDKILFPQQDKFKGDYYSIEEVWALFEKVKGSKMEMPVILAAFYGLRREEVLGLKWNAFNFVNDVFTIRHTVTACNVKGKHIMLVKDKGKSETSLRSLPLVPFLKQWLLEKKAEQERNRKLCGRSYNNTYQDYLCVDSMGDIIKPNYVSGTFPKVLTENKMRHIRFHDLRHTCAALLAASGVKIEDIMAWLGHSDIKITSDFYLHLEFSSKLSSAQSLIQTYQPQSVQQPEVPEASQEEQILQLQQQIQNLQFQLKLNGVQPAIGMPVLQRGGKG
ncbi:MAG: site-specific integrase [Clostridiaceae bacterium]|nr:site-specific integrase [Clostridiaceae bacterium]